VKSILFLAFALLLGAVAHAQSAHFSGALAILQNVALTNPYGVAVDANGNIYVADNAENSISLLTETAAPGVSPSMAAATSTLRTNLRTKSRKRPCSRTAPTSKACCR
jgi:streptogramin lyase